MPARPYVLVGNEATAERWQGQRLKLWIKTLNDFVLEATGAK
jgi:hypothetical protein